MFVKPHTKEKSPTAYPLAQAGIKELLRNNDVSITRQRVEISEFIFKRAQHLSVDDIIQGLADSGKHVARATVYNTMALFAQKGVVNEILIDRERIFYDSNTQAHQHLYNVDTGQLSDVHGLTLEPPRLDANLEILKTDVMIKVREK